MSDLVISATGLSKRYRLGRREHYKALRDIISERATKLLRGFLRRSDVASDAHVWALRDVSFEVRQGDVLGVIGRNGAGKSTLLKILSRITEPTQGFVDVRGRAGALLEVGTGFHPELTGRENIFLNAAILGMKRSEILRKFDEIVAFAEIDRFLDTVVKRYSSGMYMRLAFSVAAHLEPDILIVDEVLAVGDTTFQKKCLGKMSEVAKGGRPVIFVSHNMSAIHRLCNRAMILHEGRTMYDGTVDEAVREYLRLGVMEVGERLWPTMEEAPGNDVVRLLGVRMRNLLGEVSAHFDVHEPFSLEVDYDVTETRHQLCVVIEFIDAMGGVLVLSFDDYVRAPWGEQAPHQAGRFRATCHVPGDLMSEGDVTLNVRVFTPPNLPNDNPHIRELGVLRFSIHDRMDPAAVRGHFPYAWGPTGLRPGLRWNREALQVADAAPRRAANGTWTVSC